ncbi:MAG: hypothetical protein F6J95_006405 [Leptolyngbya sp. SIO1E4]|nr:hypothetical protein [Leptolyngbya sp. SIO1E4]
MSFGKPHGFSEFTEFRKAAVAWNLLEAIFNTPPDSDFLQGALEYQRVYTQFDGPTKGTAAIASLFRNGIY